VKSNKTNGNLAQGVTVCQMRYGSDERTGDFFGPLNEQISVYRRSFRVIQDVMHDSSGRRPP